MDKETIKKIKEAQKKADEVLRIQTLAKDSDNKEFWEEALKTLENNKITLTSNLAETNFLIDCFKNKIDSFKA